MRLLGLMQNQWLRNAAVHQRRADDFLLRRGVDHWWRHRERSIPFALFRGCKSGRVLRKHLGTLCEEIVWEETTTRISDDPSEILPIEPVHVGAVISRYKPDVVIAFGKVARRAMDSPIAHGHILASRVFVEACALFLELFSKGGMA